jgi:hypothetical protein
MTADAYRQVIAAEPRDRLDMFLATANRLGTLVGNVEKDFWVCWTLDVLYHRLPAGGPRLLFKGGTSLSKAYGLIRRFSEDIDVTVFRDDLNEPASIEDLKRLSNKKRRIKLDAIRDACRAFIGGPLHDALAAALREDTGGAGGIEIDTNDPDGQTLLVRYPEVEPRNDAYVRPAVRIESGAKSALDPNRPALISPYVADDAPWLELAVPGITTIEPGRTFWDKVVIAHGLRRWYERRGVLRQEGQRISRHYYDLHCLLGTEAGQAALSDGGLAADCVGHARIFFNRPDFDLESAEPGSFALAPVGGMVDALRRDYENMATMIFGTAPRFDIILTSVETLDARINQGPG